VPVALAVLSIPVVALLLFLAAAWWFTAPRHSGSPSDHFDGRRFRNRPVSAHAGFRDFARWRRTRQPGSWTSWTDAPPGEPPPRQVEGDRLRVTYINHATVLVQTRGLNLLTDPIWSDRCSPVPFLGPRRARPPGIRFEDLPPIDLVQISHNHYDHLDLPTLRRLARRDRPRFMTGLGNRRLLVAQGIPACDELDWWQSLDLGTGLRVVGVPACHFSGRSLWDRDGTLWMGFFLETPAGSVYFAGDTARGPHHEEIRTRLGPPRLALLPIGAYRPEWFMSRVHLSPDEALQAHEILGAGTSLGIHFGTFRLADDGQEEPVERIRQLIEARAEPRPRFWILGFGEGRDVPAA
jgi:L-ascorbate metabolism protein UlaG (beta-lactamase superfamily)